MKRILIQSIITISLFFCLIPVTYACNPLVFEIRDEEGESLSTMYLKTEVEDYIVVQVTSTANEVKDDGDGWHWSEPEGLDITPTTKTATQLVLKVNSDSVNSYNLTITAEPEMAGDNATDSCTIRAADININCPDLIGYADGMNINYQLNPPTSVPIGIIRIMNSSNNCLFMDAFYQYGPYPIDEDFPWDGKGDTSPYNGSYLPGGDYKVNYYALGFEIEKEFSISGVAFVANRDTSIPDTGTQYIPVGYSSYYMIYATSNPNGGPSDYDSYFPPERPIWSITANDSSTPPTITPQEGYCYGGGSAGLLINNFAEPGNFTITAKAGSNDTVGASIGLIEFNALLAPDQEYIPHGTGMDFHYQISPTSGWTAGEIIFKIKDQWGTEAFYDQLEDLTVGSDKVYEWDGCGNLGEYGGFLPAGKYWAELWVWKNDRYYKVETYTGTDGYFKIVIVDLDASTSEDDYEEIPGTPVMLNNDWDNGMKYNTTSGTHRECEPIWDKDYLPYCYNEDDLIPVTLSVTGADSGIAYLDITSGSDKIKLWENAIKYGSPISIPSGGAEYYISSWQNSYTFYVEGIEHGSAILTLTYSNGGSNISDTIKIDVVSLEPYQDGWTKRVINKYDTDVIFIVEPTSLSSYYSYLWDLDGENGRHDGGDWEDSTSRVVAVKYSNSASGSGNVNLPSNADNRRKEYEISVELTGGLILYKNIRVALGSYQGTVPKNTLADRLDEVPTLATTPPNTDFDNTTMAYPTQADFETLFGLASAPPEVTINAGNRLQYSTLLNNYGGTATTGTGGNLKVYICVVDIDAYSALFKQEDLKSVALHECQHASRYIQIRDGGNDWRLVNDYYPALGINGHMNLTEADAEVEELKGTASWYYMSQNSYFNNGTDKDMYPKALIDYGNMNAGTGKDAAKAILQDIYVRIPFIEMKHDDYDWSVEAP